MVSATAGRIKIDKFNFFIIEPLMVFPYLVSMINVDLIKRCNRLVKVIIMIVKVFI